jgi:hypothetical protein
MSIFRTRREVDELEDDVVRLKKRVANVTAHLTLMAGQKLTVEMDEREKKAADYEGAYNDLVRCARDALA